MIVSRRTALLSLAAGASLGSAATARPGSALLHDTEARTFRYFWETCDARTGLAPDRWPSAPFTSIAATGFALTAWPIGVTRGWITREQARVRTLATLELLWAAPQGDGTEGVSGNRGFFYHFIDPVTALRAGACELSSIDTALLLGGVLFAGAWFIGEHPDEQRIRRLAHDLYARVEWRWMAPRPPLLALGWRPETGFIGRDWVGYNEAMLLYLLALGAGEHALPAEAWAAWCGGYKISWRGSGDTRHLAFAPHFGHHYSHVWVDFRGIRDPAMRAAGLDYFVNSRRATYAQRAYAAANPGRWRGYSDRIWGLTACDGPGWATLADGRQFHGYSARGPVGFPDGFDDGTLAPTAMLASLPFAPEIVAPGAAALVRTYGEHVYGRHGFVDAFNPSFRDAAATLARGTVDARHGWVDSDRLGIDQGPILAMLANARDGLVWRTMRRSPVLRRGLARAGFTGGWLR